MLFNKHTYGFLAMIGMLFLSFSTRPVHRLGDEDFKRNQLLNVRVLKAYMEEIDSIDNWLLDKNIALSNYEIFIRAFKKEDLVELWIKGSDVDTFALFKTYKICSSSGVLGPKRKQGDKQIPEGVYYINEFNPVSNYHLSLGINYPNKSDSILGEKDNLGGEIYIHGGCESIGCMPVTTRRIKELYVIAMQARYLGQQKIPVIIYPCKLTKNNYKLITQSYPDPKLARFWGSLRSQYMYFESFHNLPAMKIDDDGKYYFFSR